MELERELGEVLIFGLFTLKTMWGYIFRGVTEEAICPFLGMKTIGIDR